MSVLSGRYAKITVYDNLVAEMGQYSMSGFNRDVLEHSAFGDTVKKFVAGHVDGGEITFSGYFDPADTDGQRVLEAAAENGTLFNPMDIKFFLSEDKFMTVGPSGHMFVTKALNVGADKASIISASFTIKVVGDAMKVYSASSLSMSASPSTSPSKSNSPSVSPSASPSA